MSHHPKKRVYAQQQFQMGAGSGTWQQGQAAQSPGFPPQGMNQPGMPVDQQIDQAANAMGNMNLGGQQMADPSAMYQQQQQQPAYGQQPTYGQQPAYGQPQQQQMGQQGAALQREVNQLYPVDLTSEIPPPISDLSLPPPPLMVPAQKMVVPSELANASPDYIRCTLNAMPKNNALLKKTKLPMALVIRPYQHLHDEINPPPITTDGLVTRCRRCRSYINPFITFIENGARWRCNFCRLANSFPAQFDKDAMTGAEMNRYDRNELRYGVTEFLAPQEYTVRQPPPSTYTFVLDVSQNAIRNGLLATTARTILESLDSLPNHDNRTRVAILCVDHALHYFSIPLDEDSDNIQMLDVCDIDEPFNPKPDSLIAPLIESRNNIEKALNLIPEIFQENLIAKFALGPALKSAFRLISGTGGKIIVASSTLPNIGEGQLQRRVEQGVANTSKESAQLLSCQDPFYKSFTIECSKAQISVDMFLASADYMDVASLSNLGRYTGGQTHFYPGFNAGNMHDVTKYTKEFSKNMAMDLSMEVVVRARGSSGIRMNSFYGHFFNRSSDLCAFSTLPRDQSYVFEMTMDDNLMQPFCYVQVAVLMSLNNSQRRIRIITMAIPTTESISEVYASADQLAMADYYTQKAISKAMNNSLDEARDTINKSVVDILSAFKKEVVSSNVPGGAPLRLCANLRMFPLLMNSLTKNMAFRSGVVPSDHRASALNYLESTPLPYLLKAIYPTVYSLHDMPDEAGLPDEDGSIVLPDAVNATASVFEKYGLFLIDNGVELFLWMGGDAVPQLVEDVFGQPNIFEIPIGKQELPVVEGSEFNEKLRNIVSKIREHDDVTTYQPLYIIFGPATNEPVGHNGSRELGSLRMWAQCMLVEDKIMNTLSYREFIQDIKGKVNK